MAKVKMSTKKKASAVVAGVLAVALALGGAYAWTDYNQTARNTFRGLATGDIVLHDDFSGENKDVYVENTGDTAVYVRVKFAEYLQIGNSSLLLSSVSDDANQKGDPNDVTTWTTHQFAQSSFDTADNDCTGKAASAHNYFVWEMTGESKAYLSGTTVADGNGYGGLSAETFAKYAATAKDPGDVPEGKITIGDITTDVYNTLAKTEIITMKEWHELYLKEKNTQLTDQTDIDRWANINLEGRWIVDSDGWAYWSKALQPYSATNLLLDAVTANPEHAAPADNWVYNIDVQLQAATLNDLNAWVRDGNNIEVADPDNQVATTTEFGFDFLTALAGGSLTTAEGYVIGGDGAYYAPEGPNVYKMLDQDNNPTGNLILAGQDELPGNEDDNVLAGRSAAKGGGIAIDVTSINLDDLTYQIAGAKTGVIVKAGIDKLLGTYDDVLISSDSNNVLGTYEIDDATDGKELVGWNYLGGTIDNMLVATEYVLDNVTPYGTSTDGGAANDYRTSNLRTTIERIGSDFGMATDYVREDVDIDMSLCSGDYVYLCIKADHSETDHTTNGNCSYGNGAYYTNPDTTNFDPITDITGQTFFALSLDEVLRAYGDSNDVAIRGLRIVQGAPAYTHKTSGGYGDGYNYNKDNSWKDGDGNYISISEYWLRSPGYDAARAAAITYGGNAYAYYNVVDRSLGARPACYLNLESTGA